MDELLDDWTFTEDEEERLRFYKDFLTYDDLRDFAQLLATNNIPYAADMPGTLIDQTIVGTGMLPRFIIKLLPEDFKRANALLAGQLDGILFADVQDHYLNQFNTDELRQILQKPDKWSVEDAQIARIILRERGVEFSDEAIRQMREDGLREIRKGREAKRIWIALYFLSILLIFVHPIFFLAGAGMGYYYAFGKTVDPDGNKHYVYAERTRDWGKIILLGGTLGLLAEILILLKVFGR